MSHWKPSGKKPDLRVLQYRVIAGMHMKTACLWVIVALHLNFTNKQAKRFPILSVTTNNCNWLFLTLSTSSDCEGQNVDYIVV